MLELDNTLLSVISVSTIACVVFAGCMWACFTAGYQEAEQKLTPSKEYWKVEAQNVLIENRELGRDIRRLKARIKKFEAKEAAEYPERLRDARGRFMANKKISKHLQQLRDDHDKKNN